jgi:hypothetical protein
VLFDLVIESLEDGLVGELSFVRGAVGMAPLEFDRVRRFPAPPFDEMLGYLCVKVQSESVKPARSAASENQGLVPFLRAHLLSAAS